MLPVELSAEGMGGVGVGNGKGARLILGIGVVNLGALFLLLFMTPAASV